MDINFSKTLLISGNDFKLTPYITLHHPSIKEILDINSSTAPDDTYMLYMQILLADPYSNMVMLDDIGKNYLEVSPYEVFIIQWDNCIKDYYEHKSDYDKYNVNPLNSIMNALSFFIKEKHIFKKGTYDNGEICFYDINNASCQINEKIFEYLYQWVRSINKIDYSGRIHPADENARRVLIEDMRDEIKKSRRRNKKKKDHSNYLGNILSAACFGGNGSISPFHINECKIYWINESLSVINKKNNSDHLLDGIYHGTIKIDDINKNDINWIG